VDGKAVLITLENTVDKGCVIHNGEKMKVIPRKCDEKLST